jgi:hypothetical protein
MSRTKYWGQKSILELEVSTIYSFKYNQLWVKSIILLRNQIS